MLKKIGRILIWMMGTVLALLIVLIVINRIDCAPPEHDLTMADLPPAEISFDNGFYGLTTLFEAQNVDVYTAAEMKKVRHRFSPQILNEPENQHWLKDEEQRFFRLNARELFQFGSSSFFNPRSGPLMEGCLKHRTDIEKMEKNYSIVLDRYRRMIQCSTVRDFTLPFFTTPVPSLLGSKVATRLYIARAMLTAADGHYDESTRQLLAGVTFWSREIASSRMLINLLTGIVNLVQMNQALADLMDQPDYPVNLYPMVENGMESIQLPIECLSRVDVGEYLYRKNALAIMPHGNWWIQLLRTLTYQKNCTAVYGLQLHARITEAHLGPPYQHRSFWKNQQHSWFWWLTNAYGKKVIREMLPSIEMEYYSFYELKARRDLLELAAGVHSRFSPAAPASEIDAFLAASGRKDPFSGQPYHFDPTRQVLYSVGRQDIQTSERPEIPCILYLRPDAPDAK